MAEGCSMASLNCKQCQLMVGQRCVDAPAHKVKLIGQQFFKLSRIILRNVRTSEKQALTFDVPNYNVLGLQSQQSMERISTNMDRSSYPYPGQQGTQTMYDIRTGGYQSHSATEHQKVHSLPLEQSQQEFVEAGPVHTNGNDDSASGKMAGFPMGQWIGRLSILDEQHSETSKRLVAQESRMFRVETIVRAEDQFTRAMKTEVERLEADLSLQQKLFGTQAELLAKQQQLLDQQHGQIEDLKMKLDNLQQMVIALVGSGSLTKPSAQIICRKRKRTPLQEDNPQICHMHSTPRPLSTERARDARELSREEQPRRSVEIVASAEAIDFSDDEVGLDFMQEVVEKQDNEVSMAQDEISIAPRNNEHSAHSSAAEVDSPAEGSINANALVQNSEITREPESLDDLPKTTQSASRTHVHDKQKTTARSKIATLDQESSRRSRSHREQSEDEVASRPASNAVGSRAEQSGNIHILVPPRTTMQDTIKVKQLHKVVEKENVSPQQGAVAKDNDDECTICDKTGKLICCDGCPRAYHRRCLDRDALSKANSGGDWFCPPCLSAVKPADRGASQPSSRASKTSNGEISKAGHPQQLIERNQLARDIMSREEGSATM